MVDPNDVEYRATQLEDENYGERRGYRVVEDDRYDERYSRRM